VEARLQVLSKYYADSYEVIDTFKANNPLAKKLDDVIDALVLAVIGVLGLRFGFLTLPETPSKDAAGLFMYSVGAKIH
jgi:predicted RNase H-like nuclease